MYVINTRISEIITYTAGVTRTSTQVNSSMDSYLKERKEHEKNEVVAPKTIYVLVTIGYTYK